MPSLMLPFFVSLFILLFLCIFSGMLSLQLEGRSFKDHHRQPVSWVFYFIFYYDVLSNHVLSNHVLSHLFWTLISVVVSSHRNQLGPRHLCHRCGRGSLRQRHRQGAGGRQRRPRVAQEPGKTLHSQAVSAMSD